MTVAQCLDYWFDNYVSTTLREKTQALYRSTVMKRMHDAFPNRPASSITVKQWVDLLTEEERDNPRRARQVLSQLRSAISWCMRRQLIDSCAIMSIQPRDFGSRAEVGDRVLSYHELAKIWLAIERSRASTSNKLLHQMLMLWGARLSELRLATKTEFDLLDNVWTVPKEHSKMGNVIRRPIFEQIKPFSDLEKRFDPSGEQRGMSTGIPSLDRMLSPKGLVKGSLFVIGARPKMGKTTLYSQMAINCAVHEKKPALMFSLEMPGDQILEKLVGQKSGVNPNIFYLPATSDADDGYQGDYDGDFNRAIETANRLSEIDLLYIDDTPGLSLAQIVSESRRIKREKGCVGMILVD